MLFLAGFFLVVFWLRDYMSLRMSPSCKATGRTLAYAATILVTAGLVWAVAITAGIENFAKQMHSPATLSLMIAFHIAAGILSMWVKRTERYNRMWATALLPAPVVWFLLLETTLLSDHSLGMAARQLSFFGVAALWATSMVVVIHRDRHRQMPLGELDFAVVFGSLSHWLVMCVLPLALTLTA